MVVPVVFAGKITTDHSVNTDREGLVAKTDIKTEAKA